MHSFKFMKMRGGGKLLLMVSGSLLIIIILMMAFVETPSERPQSIWGEPNIKERELASAKSKMSNYQAIKQQQHKKAEESNLRYKERKSKENPFFSFYKEQKPKNVERERVPTKKTKQIAPLKKELVEEKGFFSVDNSDSKKEEQFFEAVFRESQQVQDGKALRIMLKDPIPSLQLEENTILKGVPYLEGGTRLKIRITAAIVENKIRPVLLFCYDKEDCMEGLYHDDLAIQIEETTKSRLLEEALDLEITDEDKVIRKGKNILHKFSDIGKNGRKKIVIERGRELFVALPNHEDKLR